MKSNLNNEIQIIINRFKINDFDYVINKSSVLLKKIPDNDLLWNIKGLSHQSQGNIKDSITCFVTALNRNPKNIAARNNLGNSYKYANQLDLAENCFEECKNEDPNYLPSIVNLANLKTITNDFDTAIDLYLKVLKKNENMESVYVNLAQAYQSIGQFDKSLEMIKLCLSKYPNQTKFDKLLSTQIIYSTDEKHLKSMLNKLERLDINDDQKIDLNFSLGKAHEDLKNYKESFKFYNEGNLLKRKKFKFNIDDKKKLFFEIEKFFKSPISTNNNQGITDKKIIFVFGLPRSGTTLVESIISSHNQVSALGELNYLNKFFNLNFVKNNQLNLDFIENFLNRDLQSMYINHIKPFNLNTNIVTDKSLNMYWFIGFAKYFFPNAKFVHCERDPKDNCLSLFKNLFEEGEGWQYNEQELIDYYNLYKKIMIFWNSMFKDDIYNVKYENLVKNSEKEIKNIIHYCKLEWDENCLNHYKIDRPIKTLSLNQANKPIYSTSIKSSDNYQNYLKKISSHFN